MYFPIGEVFSFDMLYCLCFGIWLNEHYVSTLGLYWYFGVVNLKYKKWKFLDLQEAMKDLILVVTLVIFPFKGQWKYFPPLMKTKTSWFWQYYDELVYHYDKYYLGTVDVI